MKNEAKEIEEEVAEEGMEEKIEKEPIKRESSFKIHDNLRKICAHPALFDKKLLKTKNKWNY